MSARMGCLNASWTIHPSLSIATTGSSRPIKIKYYMTHSKISGKITKIKYKEINSEVWCCFFIDKYPNATFWLLQEVIERERLRKEDEVVFWAKKITDEFFKIDSFSRVKQIDIVQAI